MQKNLYFKFVYQSTRTLEAHVIGAALRILSFPRTLLEVFIRKNLGERYIGIFQILVITLFLGLSAFMFAPMLIRESLQNDLGDYLRDHPYTGYGTESGYESQYKSSLAFNLVLHFGTWVLFLIGFVYMSIQRIKEIKRNPSVFDFARSSVYTGDVHPFFINFRWKGEACDIRQIETILEPLFFFALGLGLIILQQYIGYVIIISSFGYWLNARITYAQGDNFIMDWIDNYLFNQEKDDAFVKDVEINNARGVRYLGRKPADPEARKELADYIIDEDIAMVQ